MGDKRVLESPAVEMQDTTIRPTDGRLRDDAYGSSRKTDDVNTKTDNGSRQGGENSATTAADNPYTYIQRATNLFDARDPARQNAKSAEGEWKKAIEAADRLPLDQYKAKLAEVESQLKTESDLLKSQQLLAFKQGLQEVISLPATLRMETAIFYLQNSKPDEAHAMLKDALRLDPTLKDREQFKQLVQISHDNSTGTVDKALDFLKSSGKELLADGIAGGAGLVAFSLTPGGRILKLGSAVLAGGATKHGLSLAGLGGDPNSALKNFAWGGVDALAMVSGAAVREKMVGSFESSITSNAAKDIAVKGGVTQAEKLSVFEGRFALEHMGGYREAAVMLEGKGGLDGLKTATALVAENVAGKKAKYQALLDKAVSSVPWYEKPLVWFEGKGLVRYSSDPRLLAVESARSEYLAARGSALEFRNLNPLNMFRSPAQFDGSLQNLKSITFWNRYKIDAASIGATSLVYRGAHEAVKIGDVDPATGKTYSAYDAATNLANGALCDAVMGGFTVGMLRGVGTGLRPKLDWVGKGLADTPFAPERWLTPTARAGLAAIPTAGALFSPQLNEAYNLHYESTQYEAVLKEIQKPLEDKSQNKPRSR